MRKVILFIAMSLDGYIANNSGEVDWLKGQGCDNENLDVYSEFVKAIKTKNVTARRKQNVLRNLKHSRTNMASRPKK